MKSLYLILSLVFSFSAFAAQEASLGVKYVNEKTGSNISFRCANSDCRIFDVIETDRKDEQTLIKTVNIEDLRSLSLKLEKNVRVAVQEEKDKAKWSSTRGMRQGQPVNLGDSMIGGGIFVLGGVLVDSIKYLPQQTALKVKYSKSEDESEDAFLRLSNKKLSGIRLKIDPLLYRELKSVITIN